MENQFKSLGDPTGQCYVWSEAYYHLKGGVESGLTPIQGNWEGTSHWALRTAEGKIIDLTVSQFVETPNYDLFRGRGFLTKEPSKKAQKIIKSLGNRALFPTHRERSQRDSF